MIDIQRVLESIDAAIEANTEEPRDYIGASIIGNECDAFLALSLRGFPNDPIKAKNKRVFRDGHAIEASVLADLSGAVGIMAGHNLYAVDPGTGKQWHAAVMNGHVACNADAIMQVGPDWAIVEIKSMNQKRFDEFLEVGLKTSNPGYWEQVQFLMGMMSSSSAIVLGYNKNTSEYHGEVIEPDDLFFAGQMARAELIVSGASRRKSAKKTGSCNWCNKKTACWTAPVPTKPTCAMCAHSRPNAANGCRWVCTLNGTDCSSTCPRWEVFTPTAR